jgi:hypothetical protein
MAQVTQLAIEMENKPGALAALCSALAERAVNISGFLLWPATGKGPVRMVVSSVETARRVCGELGLICREEQALAVQCTSRPGALGRITRKLAEAGINIEYGYGSIEKNSKRALIILGVADVEKAAKVVK